MKKRALFFLVILFSANCVVAQIPERFTRFEGSFQPEVMILGVFHFGESGDSYQSEQKTDILSEQKQKELDGLVEKIAAFRPTKILVEYDRIELDSLLEKQYKEYLAGRFDISKRHNEVYQLGFRLAARLGHQKIYCSDATAKWFGTEDIDWDNFDEDAYLESRGQLDKSERYDYYEFYRYTDSLQMKMTLREYLRFLNNPEISLKFHQVYLTNLAVCGAGDNYYGADSAGMWYRRNLRIFSNLCDIAELNSPERILMIYGASHIHTLKQFIEDSPDFIYVPAAEYL